MPQVPDVRLARAIQAHQRGDYPTAERLYRSILQGEPRNDTALRNLGVLCEQQGRWTEAIQIFREARAAHPNDPVALRSLANALMGAGRLPEGIEAFDELAREDKGSTATQFALGRARVAGGLVEAAVEAFGAATRLDPTDGKAWRELGGALFAIGRLGDAEHALRKAVEAGAPAAWLDLYGVYLQREDPKAAADALERGLRALRNDPDRIAQYGHALVGAGRTIEARGLLGHLLARTPNHPRVLFELARGAHLNKQFAEARILYRRAAEVAPDHSIIRFNLAQLLAEEGRLDEARTEFLSLADRSEDALASAAAIREALLMPVIADSASQLVLLRDRALTRIRELGDSSLVIDDPQSQIGAPGFFLAYAGQEDRELMVAIADSMQRIVEDLVWEAPAQGSGETRIRVGFVSAHLNEHTVGRITSGLVGKLNRNLFELWVLRPTGTRDAYSITIDDRADHVVELPPNFRHARRVIADLRLDVIYYPDIGMEPFTYFLAFSRLAPVQCVGWGHADTTGVPNVDYFVSCRDFETSGAEARYSETLVRLGRINVFYDRPASDFLPLTRVELGLSEDACVYLCPQSEFKLHPDYDAALLGILQADPRATIAISAGFNPQWTELLRCRFERTMPGHSSRVTFLPRVPSDRFRGLLAQADAVIDPLYFTGGHTSYLAFSIGVPVVTWNGERLRGRMTAGLYSLMGVEGPVAESIEDYVRLAVEMANSPARRRTLSDLILSRSHRLFEDEEAVREFERFLMDASARVPHRL